MISIIICCHNKKEAEYMNDLCSYCIALMGNEQLASNLYIDGKYWEKSGRKFEAAELLIYEIDSHVDLEGLKKMRFLCPNAELLLIAEHEVSPEIYLVPEIRPSSLLLKPYNDEKAIKVVRKILSYHYEKRENALGKRKLVIKQQEEKKYFDYGEIKYFEASEKKIILHYNYGEVSFYGSLKKLEKSLPSFFVRCHRSFIINVMYVNRIDLSKYFLYIKGKIVIPISKTYKNMLDDSLNTFCKEAHDFQKQDVLMVSRSNN